MLNNIRISKFSARFLTPIFFYLLLFASCRSSSKHDVDVSDEHVSLSIHRFEQDLFNAPVANMNTLKKLRTSYGRFVDLYCARMIGLPHENDSVLAFNINQYTHDRYIREVYAESQKKFSDISFLRQNLEEVFKHYKYYFPKKVIPSVITYIAPFNYNVMATDSMLGIGLDMYLGSGYKYYSSLELPQYMIRKFRKEYMVNDCIKGWFRSEWDMPSNANDLLSNMIYGGKELYFTEAMAPGMPDTIRIGYTSDQLKWANDNEKNIWTFFLENKLLYNKTPGTFMKYINDGNSTNGFPKEAPAKLGVFIGWKIVNAFMDANKNVTLEQLMQMNDAQQLLTDSNYKPSK